MHSGRHDLKLFAAMLVGAMAVASGCTQDAPTSPAASVARAAIPALDSLVVVVDTDATTGVITVDTIPFGTPKALEQALKREQKRLKKAADGTKAQLDSANRAWKLFQKQLGKHGKDTLSLLVCQPQPFAGEAKVIGPAGGTVHAGRATLVIPKGALPAPTVITAEAPPNGLVAVQFSPHGLQFQSSSSLTMSYEHCYVPDDASGEIVYIDSNGNGLGDMLHNILEIEPSKDDKAATSVRALIDHFSGYAVAY